MTMTQAAPDSVVAEPVVSDAVVEALSSIQLDTGDALSGGGLSGTVAGRTISSETRREAENLVTVALYDVLHAGQEMNLAQHPSRLRDHEFEARLYDSVRGYRTSVAGTVCAPAVPDRAPDDAILVNRQGVRIWIPSDEVVTADGSGDVRPGTSVRFDVASARPALSPGFFVYDSPRVLDLNGPALRLYVHLTNPDDAVSVWRRVSEDARATGIAFRMKILSSRALYPRRDAIVVYTSADDAPVLAQLASSLTGTEGVGDEASLFVHRLGPGLGLACEPADPDPVRAGLSFGQHRAAVIADAALTAQEQNRDPKDVVVEMMLAANIDPLRPYLNGDSTIEPPSV